MKKIVILIIFILLWEVSISGCIENTKVNNTWGEKKLSIDSIIIDNNTVGNRSENNDSVYYVNGYIINKNSFEALDPKIKIITYYANGTVFEVNDTPYLEPKNLPANDKSYFYARFEDPDKKIAKFDVKILSAKGEY